MGLLTAHDRANDTIEDDDGPVEQREQLGNIHASAMTILNPRRFKRPPNQGTACPKRSKQVRHPRSAMRAASVKIHSVYDLVDSDGISVA